MNQFERLEILVGQNIEKIFCESVLIIGLGGVGGYAAESLARSGIGKIILVDNDIIDITNLNRQIISTHNNIGLLKVDEWKKRLQEINPNIEVEIINEFITEENINLIFEKNFNYLIDACDTISTKKIIIKKCLEKNIKFISSMGTGKRFNPGMLEITDIRKTSYDPIAKVIRKMVKDEGINKKIPVVYSKEIPQKINNKKIGSNAFVPSVAGILCASYIFNLIVKEKNNEEDSKRA